MTTDELKTTITEILGHDYSSQVYFVLKQGDSLVLRLADIEDEKAAPEIKAMYTNYVNELTVNNDDLQICNLSTADERVNAIYYYDYEHYPEELGLFKDFDISKAVETEKFDFNRDDLTCLYGYIIFLGSMESGILLFKKHYPIFLIKRDSFLLGAKKDAKRFEKISGEEIIRFNASAQLLRVGSGLFVIDTKMLERNMGFTELIQKGANDSLDAINSLGIIDDIEVLRDSLDSVTFCRKLSKVKKTSPIFELKIPAQTLIDFTKTTTALSGKFKYNEAGTQIRLDTKKSKEAFIKLLNDSYLHSELTKRYYDAISKDNLPTT